MHIEVDTFKNKIKNYDPATSDNVHQESAKLADREFERLLKTREYKHIVFMAGGPGAGKSEYCKTNLNEDKENKYIKYLIYDGTFAGNKPYIKFSSIAKKQWSKKIPVSIVLIIPKSYKVAFSVFQSRERKMNNLVFIEKHKKCIKNIIKILQKKNRKKDDYPRIQLEIFLSSSRSINSIKFYKKVKKIRLKYQEVSIPRSFADKIALLNTLLENAEKKVYIK